MDRKASILWDYLKPSKKGEDNVISLEEKGDVRIFDLSNLKEIQKKSVPGDADVTNLLFGGLSATGEWLVFQYNTDKEACDAIKQILEYKADITRNTYIIIDGKGKRNFFSIEKIEV